MTKSTSHCPVNKLIWVHKICRLLWLGYAHSLPRTCSILAQSSPTQSLFTHWCLNMIEFQVGSCSQPYTYLPQGSYCFLQPEKMTLFTWTSAGKPEKLKLVGQKKNKKSANKAIQYSRHRTGKAASSWSSSCIHSVPSCNSNDNLVNILGNF